MRSLLALCVLLSLASAARADELSAELTASSASASPSDPRAGGAGLEVSGELDLSQTWIGRASAGLTRVMNQGREGTEGAWVSAFSLGADWLAGERWFVGGEAFFSPPTAQSFATDVLYTGPRGGELVAEGSLEDRTATLGAALYGAWFRGGDGWLEPSLDVALSTTRFTSRQRLTSVIGREGQSIEPEEVRRFCERAPLRCPTGLLAATEGQEAALQQTAIHLGATATILEDTDVGVGGSYYLYSDDPGEVGFFTVGAQARGGEASFGGGIPIAALAWTAKLSVAQRLGEGRLALGVNAGPLQGSDGRIVEARISGSYRLTRALRLSSSLRASRLTVVDDVSVGVSARLGLAHSF